MLLKAMVIRFYCDSVPYQDILLEGKQNNMLIYMCNAPTVQGDVLLIANIFTSLFICRKFVELQPRRLAPPIRTAYINAIKNHWSSMISYTIKNMKI